MERARDEEAISHYLARSNRKGVALCLSGGGFRAALFHLGAIRCLNDLGILPRVNAIASVSGGSVLAAFLATSKIWPLKDTCGTAEWEAHVARPFRAFASQNRRTGPILKGLLPGRSAVELFASEIRDAIGDHELGSLPRSPEFIFCATDLTFGGMWRFEREQVGDEEIGFQTPTPPFDSLALAAAVSACMAPIFAPHVFTIRTETFRNGRIGFNDPLRQVDRVVLNDGGTYDNLGLEAVWRDYETILISDGGAPHAPLGRTTFPRLVGRTLGSSNLNDQMGRLARRRWFIANVREKYFSGAYWGINSTPKDHSRIFQFGYSHDLVRTRISRIRTDLDGFSVAEQAALENHGYMVAQASATIWAREPLRVASTPHLAGPLPHPDWLDETKLNAALAKSHRRRWW